jgi:hypothetical protein
MSDNVDQTVYHAACATELATEILVDFYAFFNPLAPSPTANRRRHLGVGFAHVLEGNCSPFLTTVRGVEG